MREKLGVGVVAWCHEINTRAVGGKVVVWDHEKRRKLQAGRAR